MSYYVILKGLMYDIKSDTLKEEKCLKVCMIDCHKGYHSENTLYVKHTKRKIVPILWNVF